ncbi:MAG: hypothetical protein PHF64_05805, partial [Methanoregula sp.]|nr:hypothetical protein [Methanoregula sp.]
YDFSTRGAGEGGWQTFFGWEGDPLPALKKVGGGLITAPAPARSPPPPSGRVGIPPPFHDFHCWKCAVHMGFVVRVFVVIV